MSWIAIKDKKPIKDIYALVSNDKGFMQEVRALYNHVLDIWILCDTHYKERITLDVTHYIEIEHLPLSTGAR